MPVDTLRVNTPHVTNKTYHSVKCPVSEMKTTRKRSRHAQPSSEEPLTPETPTKRKSKLSEDILKMPCTRDASVGKRKRFSSQSDMISHEVIKWVEGFKNFSDTDKLGALDLLSDMCDTGQARYILKKIEPRFQRDFITLLPKELAMSILRYLEPKDLLNAMRTCKSWKVLCDDSLLWKDKCRALPEIPNHYYDGDSDNLDWKKIFLTRQELDDNWRTGRNFVQRELKGHDDHVITCLQFHGDRIIVFKTT